MIVRELIEKFEQKFNYTTLVFHERKGLVSDTWSGTEKIVDKYLDREVISWDVWLDGGFALEITIGDE